MVFILLVAMLSSNPEIKIPDDVREYLEAERTAWKEIETSLENQVKFKNGKPHKLTHSETVKLKKRVDEARKKFRPEISTDLSIGDVGTWNYGFQVSQVIDDSTCLAYFAGKQVMLRGPDFSKSTDGEWKKTSLLMLVSGTESFTSVGGGKRTVKTIKTFDPKEIDRFRSAFEKEKQNLADAK